MEIKFTENIPESFPYSPILISGDSSINLNKRQLLCLNDSNRLINIYEIRYEYDCSPFKQVELVNNNIAVGCAEHFYLFNIEINSNVIALKLSGYFGHMYQNDNWIYITDAEGLHCVDTHGLIVWSNNELGIDGVIINEFKGSEIHGCGELDPPNGWQDFVINQNTGELNLKP